MTLLEFSAATGPFESGDICILREHQSLGRKLPEIFIGQHAVNKHSRIHIPAFHVKVVGIKRFGLKEIVSIDWRSVSKKNGTGSYSRQ